MKTPLNVKITTIYSHLQVNNSEYPQLSELWTYLDEVLSYDINNAFFIKASSKKAFIRDMWDGKKHLFNVKSGKFLTGLLPYVIEALKQYKIPYTIEDIRPVYSKNSTLELSPEIIARNYQQDALNAILEHKRGIIFARPRSGKTLLEIMLHHEVGLTPHISVCQSLDIAQQTKKKFEQFLPGVKVGYVCDGVVDIQDVTIATIQSISAAYDIKYDVKKNERKELPVKTEQKQAVRNLVEHAKVVWVDESHHAFSKIYRYILENKIFSAEYIIGSSGTPYREDNTDKHIEGLLGPIIYEINYSTLIDQGFLVQPTIHLIKIPKEINVAGDHYPTIYKKCVIENDLRNGIIQRIAENLNAKGKSCMILVTKLNHGKNLQETIKGSKFLQSKNKDREETWEALRQKELMTLITTLGDEGLDLPNLDATIIASGGESAIKVFQRLRCMTPYNENGKEKTSAIVVDFLDPYKYLKKHSNKRKRLYKSEPSFNIRIREGKK